MTIVKIGRYCFVLLVWGLTLLLAVLCVWQWREMVLLDEENVQLKKQLWHTENKLFEEENRADVAQQQVFLLDAQQGKMATELELADLEIKTIKEKLRLVRKQQQSAHLATSNLQERFERVSAVANQGEELLHALQERDEMIALLEQQKQQLAQTLNERTVQYNELVEEVERRQR